MAVLDLKGDFATDVRPARKADGRRAWAKDPSSAESTDGTRLDATFVNDLLGMLRRLFAAAGLSPAAGDDAALAAAVAAIAAVTPPAAHTHSLDQTTDTDTRVAMTPAERAKLAALVTNYKGAYASLAAVVAAYPAAVAGDWAVVSLVGEGASIAVWDSDATPAAWVDVDGTPPAAASGTSFTPAGNISATNVQAALQELDSEKQASLGFTPVNRAGDTMTGPLLIDQAASLGGNVDLNTIIKCGFYRIQNTPVNAPVPEANYSQMIVSRGQDTIMQMIVAYSTGTIYVRSGAPAAVGGVGPFGPWRTFWHSGNFDPASKTDSALTNVGGRLGPNAKNIADWNAATENGWYMADRAANEPSPSGWWIGHVEAHTIEWVTQTLHYFANDGPGNTYVYRRAKDNGTWGAWYKLQLSQAEQDARYVRTVNGSGPDGSGNVAVTAGMSVPTNTGQSDTTYNVGTILLCQDGGSLTANAAVTVRHRNSGGTYYFFECVNAAGTALAGTWRVRGTAGGYALVQRVA